jgi:glycosyltransferase involved in cell wall biosynthesis
MVKVSIIFVHYSTDDFKSYIGETCLKKLWKYTKGIPEIELIVVNNGERDNHFKDFCNKYFDNQANSLGGARNIGFDNSVGEYICFMDNDIYIECAFWNECIELLEKYPDKKLIATPIYTPHHVLRTKYQAGELDGHLLNTRSGSNCLFMKRSSFEDIGRFCEIHPARDGVKFCNAQCRKGYLVIHTRPLMARDLGIGNYDYKKTIGSD